MGDIMKKTKTFSEKMIEEFLNNLGKKAEKKNILEKTGKLVDTTAELGVEALSFLLTNGEKILSVVKDSFDDLIDFFSDGNSVLQEIEKTKKEEKK